MDDRPVIFLSAGEVSGDMHGAHLARALLARRPDLRLVGVGGPRMRDAGVEVIEDVTSHSAVGLTEQLPHVLPVLRAFRRARKALTALAPKAVVPIDFQGANVPLARFARQAGIPVAYYILPQEWLWGLRGGLAKVARSADVLLSLFPAEAEAYERAGGRVARVGHPLLDILAPCRNARPAGQPTIALLPGSRRQEIEALLPLFVEAAARIRRTHPTASFTLPVARRDMAPAIARAVMASRVPIAVTEEPSQAVIGAATAALVASGTATLEAALLDVPCVAAYQVSPLTAFVASRLLKVPFVTLPNIVAGRAVIPEFLQGAATPGALAGAIAGLIDDPDLRLAQLDGYADVKEALGGPGALDRASAQILATAGLGGAGG